MPETWLRRYSVCVLDWPACSPDLSPIEMDHDHEKEKQTTMTTDYWAAETLSPARMDTDSSAKL